MVQDTRKPCFRTAKPADAETLSGLAQRAKASWGYPPAWLAEWRPLLSLSPADLATLSVMVAEVEGRVVGSYALALTRPHASLEHLWIEPADQRRGWGRRLLAHALDAARNSGATALRIEADPHAVPFYDEAGAHLVGERSTTVAGEPRSLPLLEIKLGTA